MYSTYGYAKKSADAPFEKITISRNEPGDDDVQFDVAYCGICHGDVLWGKGFIKHGPWATKWPIVPGHELAGVVTKVGKNVTDIAIGDRVGVGTLSDSCMQCRECDQDLEHFCEKGSTMTYSSTIEHGHISTDSGYTYGGYSGKMTANRRFILKIPDGYPLEMAGPIFCAGITMFSPLNTWEASKGGQRVGIIGIGGLGQMGVRMAKAMGNTVAAISTNAKKQAAALEMGADTFIHSADPDSMKAAAGSLDLIINTASGKHDLPAYMELLARDGTIVQVGGVMEPHSISQFVLFRRIRLSGSKVGGIKETQDCIDFCAKNNIQPTIQLVTADQLAEVYDKLTAGNDEGLRYVLDLKASS